MPRVSATKTWLWLGLWSTLAAASSGPPEARTADTASQASLTSPWSGAASMSRYRFSHTATLLPSGKVLVVNDDGAVAAAEVYSPSSGTWTQVSAPPAFFGHAAVKLDSGAVLATGQENFQYESGAWLYWPEDDHWEYVAYANETRRRGHSLTLLPPGQVLVVGGTSQEEPEWYSSAELFTEP